MKQVILALGLIAVAITGCSKKGGGGTANVTSYYLSDGTCYERSTNDVVDDDKCDGVLYYFSSAGTCRLKSDDTKTTLAFCEAMVERYFYADNKCYDKQEKEQVDTSKCEDLDQDGDDDDDDDDDDDNDNTIPAIKCVGSHYDADIYDWYGVKQRYNCSNNYNNCRGYYMYDSDTNKLVFCK